VLGVLDNQGRMIAKTLLFVDRGRLRGASDAFSGDMIIDTPTNIIRPCLTIKQTNHTVPFFRQKAGVVLTALLFL
jgi:hypothetical protein